MVHGLSIFLSLVAVDLFCWIVKKYEKESLKIHLILRFCDVEVHIIVESIRYI